MADFSALKTAIQANIRTNGNEEINGAILQDILLSMVTTMGDGAINSLAEALAAEVTARQNAVGGEATTRVTHSSATASQPSQRDLMRDMSMQASPHHRRIQEHQKVRCSILRCRQVLTPISAAYPLHRASLS